MLTTCPHTPAPRDPSSTRSAYNPGLNLALAPNLAPNLQFNLQFNLKFNYPITQLPDYPIPCEAPPWLS